MSDERIILMEHHRVSLKPDATGALQIRFGASWEPGWFLDPEQAERLCMHVLTDASDELIITGVPAGPEQPVYPGALLVTKDQDKWVFAHSCEEPLPEMIVRSRLWKYQSNWEALRSWDNKPAFVQKFLTQPKEPQVEKLQYGTRNLSMPKGWPWRS
ncbi:MAG: hypothetical protein FJ011_21825 [Chloroflexi bacterium]|nr:hypothetical protein [Chloroflexota bacterium]